jgi:hypothetical protein
MADMSSSLLLAMACIIFTRIRPAAVHSSSEALVAM